MGTSTHTYTRTVTTGGYGWVPDLPDNRDRIYNLEEPILRKDQAPINPLGRALPNPALNQLNLGACTAHGIEGANRWELSSQGLVVTPGSRLELYYHEREAEGTITSDSGAQIRTGIKVMATKGIAPESDWPYDPAQFAVQPPARAASDDKKEVALAYQRVEPLGPGSPMRTALAQKPVVFGFSVPERFEDPNWNPRTQYLPIPSGNEGFIGGHCVLAYDFDFTRTRFKVPVFKIRNSWSPEWGEDGDFYMDATWFWESGLVSDCWVITRIGARA